MSEDADDEENGFLITVTPPYLPRRALDMDFIGYVMFVLIGLLLLPLIPLLLLGWLVMRLLGMLGPRPEWGTGREPAS